MTTPLKLYARDAHDVQVISTYMQDAVAQIGDMTYLAKERRFVILANRFCWEDEAAQLRVRAALQIGAVTSIQQKNLTLERRDGVLSVLAVQMDEASKTVQVIFSGGGEIRLEVEACEAILEDITAPWGARTRPAHNVPEPTAEMKE